MGLYYLISGLRAFREEGLCQNLFVNLGLGTNREFVDPRTASLGVKSSKRNRELENSASLGPRVCEVLLYFPFRYGVL